MKAYELHDRQGLDSLVRVEREIPRPGPGQVLVRMRAWSLNYRDLLVAQGLYGRSSGEVIIPLSDGVGVVEETGPGVTRVKAGERVAGTFLQDWIDGELTPEAAASALGGDIDGVLAEYAVLPDHGLVKVPAHLSDADAACLPCAALTAWNALVRESRLKAGDTVVLLGTGGVSLFGLQFAKMHGARTLITSSSDAKLELARRMGADATVNYVATPDWAAAVREFTGGRGADVVLEVGGAGTFDQSVSALRIGGRVCVIGVLAGITAPINTAAILRGMIRVSGIYVGSRAMFEEMNRAIETARMRPHIDRSFGFDEARAAFEHLARAGHSGKVVIVA
jgi:NADPH:quinone reductase-like Zn-dependent oxidoreductase